jgi:hypothetical protein
MVQRAVATVQRAVAIVQRAVAMEQRAVATVQRAVAIVQRAVGIVQRAVLANHAPLRIQKCFIQALSEPLALPRCWQLEGPRLGTKILRPDQHAREQHSLVPCAFAQKAR